MRDSTRRHDASYLQWLSSGKSDPSAYIGYVTALWAIFLPSTRRSVHRDPNEQLQRANNGNPS
jgi:hypothetical protein